MGDVSAAEPRRWLTGVLFSVAASFAGSLGNNLVRRSYDIAKRSRVQTPVFRRPLFLTGWACTLVINTPLNLMALHLAPASLIMPLTAVTVLINIPLANAINGEPVTETACRSTMLIFAGILCVVTASDKESRELGPATLAMLFDALQWKAFALCSAVLTISLGYTARRSAENRRWCLPAMSGMCCAFTNVLLKVLVDGVSAGSGAELAHEGVSGVGVGVAQPLSGQPRPFGGNAFLALWTPWLVLPVLAGLALTQLVSLNRALVGASRLGACAQFVPSQHCQHAASSTDPPFPHPPNRTIQKKKPPSAGAVTRAAPPPLHGA